MCSNGVSACRGYARGMDPRAEQVVQNLVGMLDRFAPYGTPLDEPEVQGVLTDLPSPMFNVVAAARFADPVARTAQVAARLFQRRLPFLWVVDDASREVGAALASLGLAHQSSVAMHCELEAPRQAPTLEEVAADELVELTLDVFGLPPELASAMRERVPALADDAVHLALRVDGHLVAGGSGLGDGTSWGLYNIATLPEHRGRGHAATVVEGLLAAGARRGYGAAVLDASADGKGVYERAGFTAVGVLEQYVWLP